MRPYTLLACIGAFGAAAAVGLSPDSVYFATHVDFPVGSSPLAIVTADFNKDTNPDVAVVNNESDNVTVLLGNGTGGFTATGPFDVSGGPAALAAGDFNNDTTLDLVVTADIDNVVNVLTGNGNGTFTAGAEVEVGRSPDGIAVGNFNNDANLDFATTNYFEEPGTVSVVLGNGNGTFQEPQTVEVDLGPLGIAVGRLNADGNDDMVVGLYDLGVVYVLLGNGDGTFQQAGIHQVGLEPTGVLIRDLNDDQIADVAVANEDSNSVGVLLGTGGGAFADMVEYPVGMQPQGVAAGDFNGDDILDLVTADLFGTTTIDNSVSVLIGMGDGVFGPAQSFNVNRSPFGVEAANFGGNELPDLVSVNLDSNDVSLLTNESLRAPTRTSTTTAGIPTPTPGNLLTPTPSPPLTATSTAIVRGVEIRVDTVNAAPGSQVAVNVILARHGEVVEGTQNDITFDPDEGANISDISSCVINPAISDDAAGCEDDPNSGPCKQLNRALDDVEGGLRRFRGLILSLVNAAVIPDGTLYTCTFTVAEDAEVGLVLPLECSNEGAFGADSYRETVCVDGAIRVVAPMTTTPSSIVTRTATPTPSPSPTPPTAAICASDCDGNGRVTIEELVRAVRVTLDQLGLSSCLNADRDGDGFVRVNELVAGVNAALQGCDKD